MTWYLAFKPSGCTAKAVRPVISGNTNSNLNRMYTFLLLMFTTTDCSCHNLTILITLLSKPIVLHWNTCKIWMDYWLFLQVSDRARQSQRVSMSPGGREGSTRCVKRVVFRGWMMCCLQGCQSFKNQKWSFLESAMEVPPGACTDL